jgi:hypothetical protein
VAVDLTVAITVKVAVGATVDVTVDTTVDVTVQGSDVMGGEGPQAATTNTVRDITTAPPSTAATKPLTGPGEPQGFVGFLSNDAFIMAQPLVTQKISAPICRRMTKNMIRASPGEAPSRKVRARR